ncbi:MAG TPA: AAA family ATPase [Solirubrobacterales bacterium]|nr:AAA family ATPase [Solirubrobacterales bacterium]
MSGALSGHLETATEHQPRVRAGLVAALERGPAHAYLFHGPAGTGKRATARAFAAELMARDSAPDAAEEARRRALMDPSPHPDLAWLRPDGARHRVELIRERVIRAATRHAFEGGAKVFVIESAEAMGAEGQNALLKTLEEPPGGAYLILMSTGPEGVLATVRSRCQLLEFRALPPAVVEARLRAELATPGAAGAETGAAAGEPVADATIRAACRLAGGDEQAARLLLGPVGRQLREGAERLAAAGLAAVAHAEPAAPAAAQEAEPWAVLLKAAEAAGKQAEQQAEERIDREAEFGLKLSKTESGQAVRRESRRARTELLDLGLQLSAAWLRDLAAVAAGAEDVVHNTDRLEALREQAGRASLGQLREAAELVGDHRRRLRLNVSEELTLEALDSRLRRRLAA